MQKISVMIVYGRPLTIRSLTFETVFVLLVDRSTLTIMFVQFVRVSLVRLGLYITNVIVYKAQCLQQCHKFNIFFLFCQCKTFPFCSNYWKSYSQFLLSLKLRQFRLVGLGFIVTLRLPILSCIDGEIHDRQSRQLLYMYLIGLFLFLFSLSSRVM